MDSEAVVERRLLAELTRQQIQSEEDRRWLQMQEENLVTVAVWPTACLMRGDDTDITCDWGYNLRVAKF